MSVTVASKVPFSEVSGLLEKIEKLSAKKGQGVSEAKKNLVKKFIVEWREFNEKLHADDPNTVNIYANQSDPYINNPLRQPSSGHQIFMSEKPDHFLFLTSLYRLGSSRVF